MILDRRRTMLGLGAFAVGAGLPRACAALAADTALRDAFYLGFPLFEFARTAALGGRWNQIVHRRRLTDPSQRAITATNNDCLVSNARLDLSSGPIAIAVPDIPDRYFSVMLMDAFTDTLALIGTRTTKGRGGIMWLTPPGWRGVVPRGARHIASPSVDVWMLVRILVDGPADYALVNALQDRIVLTGQGAPVALPVPPRDVTDPANFLAVVNAMLARIDARDPRVRRAARHAAIGVRRGDVGAFAKLDPALRSRWRRSIGEDLAQLPTAGASRRREAGGWSYSLASTGTFGTDDFQRAQIALIGLAALPPQEAFYGHGLVDAQGRPLDGAHRYRLRIPPGGPPVDAFWSVTMYQIEPDGRLFLSTNPIDRYSIGDRTKGLLYSADGSLDIVMQHSRPEGPLAANWLPTPPGPMRPAFRGYLARKPLLDLRWRLPPIERIADG